MNLQIVKARARPTKGGWLVTLPCKEGQPERDSPLWTEGPTLDGTLRAAYEFQLTRAVEPVL